LRKLTTGRFLSSRGELKKKKKGEHLSCRDGGKTRGNRKGRGGGKSAYRSWTSQGGCDQAGNKEVRINRVEETTKSRAKFLKGGPRKEKEKGERNRGPIDRHRRGP